ncbi:sugar ABC transporter permease [Aquibium sp. A9E412]|uniref:carbohydrate ABC transporter permease n=1 Tax=Aquibium sp. A9E412 TaxID=2976767 RepID=UPI0025B12C03|nr:sugar ABC transporter permease [Aquibium sp. A9E412]MDN2566956.1 sugar ABC transporter permease [Aquibium sp. A9E412]
MALSWRFWFLAPMVMALATVVLFPTVYLFWMSTQHWLVTDPQRFFVGTDNFQRLLAGADFWQALRVTAAYLVLSTVIMLGLGLGMALTFARAGRGWMRAIVVMPLVIPPVVAGFTWRFLLNGEIGFLGAWLLPAIGLELNPLAEPRAALVSVVIADVWSRTPFMFLILLAALQSIPRDFYEAARMDGANPFHEFFFITLPLLKGALFVAILFRIVDAINTFELIYVMTRGGPGRATQILSIFGWRTAFQELDFGQAAALGVVLLFICLAGAMLLFRRFVQRDLEAGA